MTLAPVDGNELIRWAEVLAPARQLAEVIAATEFVPKAMRNQPDVVTAAIMYGDEIGVGPMQAMAGIHVVEGRPAPSAELMRALILRAGHTIGIHEMSGTKCRVSGLRAGRPESERVTVEWTLDMARSAGLLGRQNWQRYPRAMLLARATSDLARIVFPDVVKGLGYIAEDVATAGELEAWAPFSSEQEHPATQAPARPEVRRRTTPQVRSLDASPAPAGSPSAEHKAGEPEAEAEPGTRPDPAPAPPDVNDPIDQPVTPATTDTLPPCGVDEPLDEPAAGSAPVPDGFPSGAEPTLPMPDLAPEQPAPEPEAKPLPEGVGPARIGDGQLRAMHAAWRKLAPHDPNQELNDMRRHEWSSDVVGRSIETWRDLLRAEGFQLQSELAKVEAGLATFVDTDDGWLRVREYPEHPATSQDEPAPDDPWGRPSQPWDEQP